MFIILGFVDVKYFLQQSSLVILSSLPFLHILIEQKLFFLQQAGHHVGGISAKRVFKACFISWIVYFRSYTMQY